MDKCIVTVYLSGNKKEDLDIPLDISAVDLISAIKEIYGIDNVVKLQYGIRVENPICFLRGTDTLRNFGIHEGSIFHLE